jgi:hypothetical protein
MAVILNIPMTFEFRPYPATWLHRRGSMLGFSKERDEASKPLVHYVGSDEDIDAEITSDGLDSLSGLGSVLGSESYTARLAARGIPNRMAKPVTAFEEQSEEEDGQFEILTCTRLLRLEPGKERDAWQMRDEFFGLKRKTEALGEFLDKWGIWDWYTILRKAKPARLFAPPERSTSSESSDWRFRLEEHFVIPERIWDLQDFYRIGLQGPPDEWFAYAGGMSAVMGGKVGGSSQEALKRPGALIRAARIRSEYPHLLVRTNFCREAIEATITFDHLRKIKTRICKRADCMKPFPIESRHKRKYCSQYCGHLESMRRQSREQAKQKQKARKRG